MMSAEERTAAGKKGYENGIGVMSAEERMPADKRRYDNKKWEEQYAEFEDYDEMPERGSAFHKWHRNQLNRLEAGIKTEIADCSER